VSGAILLTVSTVLYTQGILSLPEIATLAFVGAILADHFGYYLGLIFGPHLEKSKFVNDFVKAWNKVMNLDRFDLD